MSKAKNIYRTQAAAHRAAYVHNMQSADKWTAFRLPNGYFVGTLDAYERYKAQCSTSE